jgi:hypothetical protein
MDSLERKLRAKNYRIEIVKYNPGIPTSWKWAKYKVYKPRRPWSFISGTELEGTYEQAFNSAERVAKDKLNHYLKKKWEKKQPKEKKPKPMRRTIFIAKDGESPL